MSDKLKPCPFCGNDLIDIAYRVDRSEVSWSDGLGSPGTMTHSYYQVLCGRPGCSASINGRTEADAIENWNKRQQLATVTEQRDRAWAALRFYDRLIALRDINRDPTFIHAQAIAEAREGSTDE